jgi:hypothetical protein
MQPEMIEFPHLGLCQARLYPAAFKEINWTALSAKGFQVID